MHAFSLVNPTFVQVSATCFERSTLNHKLCLFNLQLKAKFCLIFNVEDLPEDIRSKLQLSWIPKVLYYTEKKK